MVLVSTIKEIVNRQHERAELTTVDANVCTSGEIDKRIGRSGSFGAAFSIEMVLAQVHLATNSSISVVEHATVADEIITNIEIPTRGGRERQILGLSGLMELHTIDIREGVGDMELFERMNVDHQFTSHQASVATLVLINFVIVLDERFAQSIELTY